MYMMKCVKDQCQGCIILFILGIVYSGSRKKNFFFFKVVEVILRAIITQSFKDGGHSIYV